MKIINIKNNDNYINEYIILCNKEWGNNIIDDEYIENKKNKIINGDKVISVLGLINNDILIGFISLFTNDGINNNLTPWYATMFVKEEYRGKGYSKILNDAIIKEATKLGYKKLYLKTNLINYYEKFGFHYLEELDNNEKLYYIDL